MVTDELFTRQRQIAELGIYHYGERFYTPKFGRFLSPGTVVPGYANPQKLNHFRYVTNNPLRYTIDEHLETKWYPAYKSPFNTPFDLPKKR